MADCLAEHRYVRATRNADPVKRLGRVVRVMPTFVEADGPAVPLGSLCLIQGMDGASGHAEVVQVAPGRVTLAPFTPIASLRIGDVVCAARIGNTIPVGTGLLGRVVDPLCHPLDGGVPLTNVSDALWPLGGVQVSPLERKSPDTPLETGIRVLDGLLTLGVGQRIGIFAGSGVGKTTLLNGIARNIQADVCVVCLVGERGREVEAFWRETVSDEARSKTTMVVATSDRPAVMRARAIPVALSIAEFFRAQGAHVLLLLDSVTRYALALREIGLAAGEPPTLRAYTPSVFAALPGVVERCGALKAGGAITAVMTVLTETEDVDDPMAETMRALLDGHVVLTRSLAEQMHFPPIDVPRSVSRVLRNVTEPYERQLATTATGQLALYEASRTLIEAGLYVKGTNPALDRALATRPALLDWLQQDVLEPTPRADALGKLAALLGEAHGS